MASDLQELKRSWPGNIDETIKAMQTQYQFRSDAIVARNSHDAPTIEQLCLIRDAHLNIYNLLKELRDLRLTTPPKEKI